MSYCQIRFYLLTINVPECMSFNKFEFLFVVQTRADNSWNKEC
jgi:hypothetical protein